MKYVAVLIIIFFLNVSGASAVSLSQEDIRRIGDRVFENECASKDSYLVQWNQGEEFLSLGIGHFIWYPKTDRKTFEETFPVFLRYAENSGAVMPEWLKDDLSQPCPWNSREEFLNDRDSVRLHELRKFLKETKPTQASFITGKIHGALAQLLKHAPLKDRRHVYRRFLEAVNSVKYENLSNSFTQYILSI